jgi:CRISPR/Cas system-associated exonuclease Cas4 (RecB family)
MKLFRSSSDDEIKTIRVSTLASYYYCAMKAWLQAQGIESPPNQLTEDGTKLHNAITAARPPSQLEIELENHLKQYMIEEDTGKGSTGISGTHNKVFVREWLENNKVVGKITSHGCDDFRVFPDKTVVIVEYKSTGQKIIDWYKLSTAIFQLKVYMWMLEPILKMGGYSIRKAEIVYVNRKGEPLGTKQIVDYDERTIEDEIRRVFEQFRDPANMIPPSRFKCYNCHPNFKSRCLFQKGVNPQ